MHQGAFLPPHPHRRVFSSREGDSAHPQTTPGGTLPTGRVIPSREGDSAHLHKPPQPQRRQFHPPARFPPSREAQNSYFQHSLAQPGGCFGTGRAILHAPTNHHSHKTTPSTFPDHFRQNTNSSTVPRHFRPPDGAISPEQSRARKASLVPRAQKKKGLRNSIKPYLRNTPLMY